MQSRRHEGTKTTHEDHENTKTRNRVSRRNAKGTPIGSTRRPATQPDINGRKDRGRESHVNGRRLTSPIFSTVVAPLRGAPSDRGAPLPPLLHVCFGKAFRRTLSLDLPSSLKRPDDSDAEHGCGLVAGRGLEAHGHFLFPAKELRRNPILDVEEPRRAVLGLSLIHI